MTRTTEQTRNGARLQKLRREVDKRRNQGHVQNSYRGSARTIYNIVQKGGGCVKEEDIRQIMGSERESEILLSPSEKAGQRWGSRGVRWHCVLRAKVNKCRKQHHVQKTHHCDPNHWRSIARSIFRRMDLDTDKSTVAPSFSNVSIARKASAFPSSSRPC